MRRSIRNRLCLGLLASTLLDFGLARAASDLSLESAHAVNEGPLHFLETLPAKAIHHHQNRIRIGPDSLASGWVDLSQCHDHLDPVPSAQISFREGRVRKLKIDLASGIGKAWVEGASVQLQAIEPGARLCLSLQTHALHEVGPGRFNLANGPYMRKFLDGYYPMRVTLEVDYPATALSLVDISPTPQPGLSLFEQPGSVRLEAVFEGELRTLVRFAQP